MSSSPAQLVQVMIDDRLVDVPAGSTIYEAAARAADQENQDNPIPILCHREHLAPVAVCRVCVVDINPQQQGKLVPACITPVQDKMQIRTAATSQRVQTCVKVLTEMLAADHLPASGSKSGNDELAALAERALTEPVRLPGASHPRGQDHSSVVIDVDHDACILCDRCVRACSAVNNDVIGRMGKGYSARIAFDLDDPMGNSSCVACGECMVACPTGALTARYPVGHELVDKETPDTVELSVDELIEMEMFQGVSKAFLRWNEGAVVRRRFPPGAVLCREGDAGSTAFYVEEGELSISIDSALARRQHRRDAGSATTRGWHTLRGLLSKAPRSNASSNGNESERRYIHIDAPVALDRETPIATMGAGQIVGEQSCLNMYPRSATVRAATECVVLEMSRKVLYIMQRNKLFKEKLDTAYRERALRHHLRGATLFADLGAETIDEIITALEPHVVLERFEPGQTIFEQGAEADAFYFVRTGFVRVSQDRPGGTFDRSYVGQGECFGETALLGSVSLEVARLELEVYGRNDRRTATCTALDHVELLRFDKQVFLKLLNDFPPLATRLVAKAVSHLTGDRPAVRQVEEPPIREFLEQGLYQAQSLLVLDLEKCTRCDECSKACADVHDGVTRLVREGLRFDQFLVASSCRTCHDPYCTRYCPVDAIHPKTSLHRAGAREMVIEDHCIGCGLCAENCPYGNINMSPIDPILREDPTAPGQQVAVVHQQATTCDMCRHTSDGQPSCVYACPHDAAHRWDGREFWDRWQRGQR